MKIKPIYKAVGFSILFVLIVLLANEIKDNAAIQGMVERFGYAGVFVLAFISGFNVLVPVPAMSFLPIFSAAGLDTIILIMVISLGMTVGDGVGYILGRLGRTISKDSWPQWLIKAEVFVNKYKYGLPVFLFLYAAFVPLPNELVVIPAAVACQRWWQVLVPVFLGNFVLNTFIALGISSVF